MKFIIPLLALSLVSCKKDAIVNDPNVLDSMMVKAPLNKKPDSILKKDSLIANSPAVAKVLDEGVNRKIKENKIVRTADGVMLPFTIGDEITADEQSFVLKLSNVTKPKLKITVDTKKPMNIRINQIKKPDGTFDGPFGKMVTYDTTEKGEYWIILDKSQMAGGNAKGHFSLKVE